MSAASPALHVAEPPASYLQRPPLVVDCSVLSAVLFDETSRAQAASLLAGKTLHAPTLLDCEMVSVALKKARAGWPADSVAQALADYAVHDIARHATEVGAQFAIAQRYGLNAYDAAYLWLAAELRAPLATFDDKLAQAARTHLAGLP